MPPVARSAMRCGLMLLIALAPACDQRALFEQMIPKDDAAFGERVVTLVRTRDFAAFEALLDPSSSALRTRQNLEQIASMFPAGEPRSVKVIGAFVQASNGDRFAELTYEHEFAERWLVTAVRLRHAGEGMRVQNLQVTSSATSQEELNRFTFSGRTVRHYAMFVAALAAPAVVFVALVLLVRTPIPALKWLWAVIIVVCMGQVGLNWTTGEMRVQLIALTLFGSGVFKAGPYGPITLVVSLPLGALVFLRQRRLWMQQGAARAGASQDAGE